jgi:formylglycine-generating enzyme
MVSGFKMRWSGVVVSLGALVAFSQGCGIIVGIEETTVGSAGEASDGGTGGAGAGGKGGTAGKGGGTGGAATGGAPTGGSAGKGGASGGSAGSTVMTGGSSGAGGSTAGAPGTGGATGGTAGAGGTTGGSSGTNASGSGGSGDSGAGGSAGDCGGLTSRCTDGVREVCTDGVWSESACPLDTPTCEDGECIVRGPTMISVVDYFIDSTEVTVEQYEAFVTAKAGDTSGQIGNCGWNDSYEPSDDPGSPTWPVSYVDWCDADAYCKWADKHLCGRMDREQITYEELTLANDSQWFRACGGPGGSPHPNGDPVCNSNGGFDSVAPVGSFPGCEGYYDGIFDMEGNVAEWVDLCEGTGGATDICYAMGGSVVDNTSYCDEIPYDFTRDTTAFTTGFRCCSG